MAYVSKMDLRIKLAKLSSAVIYGIYILTLSFILFSLGACSSQLETARKIKTVEYRIPIKKIDSIKGGLKFQSPIRVSTIKKCN